MTPSRSVRILLCSVAVACAFSLPKAAAQLDPNLLAWEPFNYSTTPSGSALDRNSDGNVDLWGLNGGVGFGGAWVEYDGEVDGYSLDYIQPLSLGVPASSAGLLTEGGSLRSYMLQTSPGTTLARTLASPIAATEGSTLWLSFLVQMERVHSNVAGAQPTGAENFTFSLRTLGGNAVTLGDALAGDAFPNEYFLKDYLNVMDYAGRGSELGKPDLIVVKLSFLANAPDTMDLFLNPTPGVLPTNPVASIEITKELSDIASIQIETIGSSPSSYRTQWSFDEIRIGKTYDSVTPVPEPSSLLLAGFGLGAAGFTRLRRNRAA